MNLDLTKLIPVGEQMIAAGLPSIGTLLSKVVPFPFSLTVEPLFNAVATALNIDPAAPDAPAQVQAQVTADPAAAAAKLQTVEQAHKDMADAANEELRLRLLDVQDARSTTVSLASSGSTIAWGAPVVSTIIVAGFVGMLTLLAFHTVADSTLMNVMMGTLATAFAAVVNYWLGSSAGSVTKDQHLAELARSPTVNAGPGSHVSGGVVARK